MAATGQPTVRLDHFRGPALILNHPTGIVYANEAGGTSRAELELEGVLVPLDVYAKFDGSHASFEGELTDHFIGPKHDGKGAAFGLDIKDADHLDRLFEALPADMFLRVDRRQLEKSMEAWVWITLEIAQKPSIRDTMLHFPQTRMTGVLTWPNSG